VAGAAATNGSCNGDSATCNVTVSDVTTPAGAFADGELARVTVTCRETGTDQICLAQPSALLVDGNPATACDVACVPFECGSCTSGDCNQSGSTTLDASDATCTAQCLIGTPPPGADCSCAADCNCAGGVEAADASCTLLRAAGHFNVDPCASAVPNGGFIAADAEVTVGAVKVLGAGPRRRVFVRLVGDDAGLVGALRVGLSVDGTLGRIQLARRLRLAGFSLLRSRAGVDHAVAVITAPIDGTKVKAFGKGRLLRVLLKGATQTLATSGVELGSVSGLPIAVSEATPSP
jgi:hypothetical protein